MEQHITGAVVRVGNDVEVISRRGNAHIVLRAGTVRELGTESCRGGVCENPQQLAIGRRIGVDLKRAKARKQAGNVQSDNLFAAVVDLPIVLQLVALRGRATGGVAAVTAAAAAHPDALLVGATVIPNQVDAAEGAERIAVACRRRARIYAGRGGYIGTVRRGIDVRLSEIDVCPGSRPCKVVNDRRRVRNVCDADYAESERCRYR